MTDAGKASPADGPPLVTVVIPTWNRRDLVEQAVASVIAQTMPNWELIVVDDGSTDGTVERLRSVADPRVRVVAARRINNISRLRNIGVAAGSGEWIAFLDSDDLWLPEKLERQREAVEGTNAAWCYSQHGLIGPDGKDMPIRSGAFAALSGRIAEALLREQTSAAIGTLLIRRSLFEAVGGFDETLTYRADLDLELRLAVAADAAVVPDVLARTREHPGRVTSGLSAPHEQTAKVYEKFIARNPPRHLERLARRKLAYHRAEAGAHRLSRGEIGRGLRLLATSLANGAEPVAWLRAAARGLRNAVFRRRSA